VVYPLGAYDESSFQKSLDKFRPSGWTPLAAAIEQAKSDLSEKTGENVENIIYVVSDGIETCGGDPVKAAKELHESEIQAIVNIIGFDVDNAGQRALKKVAEAGGGKYTTVSTGEDLKEHLEGEYRRLRIEWMDWENESYLDAQQQWTDKWEKMSDLTTLLSQTNHEENTRMLNAKDYLESRGKLQNPAELYTKISDRWKKITEYKKMRYKELNEILDEERIKEQKRVREKEKEMLDQYDH